jgi:predicted CoA-binding protein
MLLRRIFHVELRGIIMSDIATLRRIYRDSKTLAIVGLSADWFRPSYFAAKYMQEHGYRVIPVNPKYSEILGEKCYPDLHAIPEQVDLVDVFRKSAECVPIAADAAAIGAKVFWMQIDVVNEEAKRLAEAAGLTVVMDRCVKIEYARLFGGLNWMGVNTRLISSRRPTWIPH